jgi:hypothetical protein
VTAPAGVYRVRIDRPDGSHVCAESSSLPEAFALCGFADVSDELQTLVHAARVLDRAIQASRQVVIW